ncbi:hypothetical protein [Streptomyces sp. NPDC007063]|uniref:hypothetical protein n=1 Tax=Streptomyces sp. NPDC007063 TaxID=3364772 RepID=UPI00367B5ABC
MPVIEDGDSWEIPVTEETTDENGNTVIIGYPSDGDYPLPPPNIDPPGAFPPDGFF